MKYHLPKCLIPVTLGSLPLTVQAQTPHIAFVVPAGQAGNQPYGSALGNTFDVVIPITLSRLGCFDDLSDGLVSPITVQLYDRNNPATPLVEMIFPPDDPATADVREDGVLVGGNRFLPLASPLNLPAGFQGMIVASGYGSGDRNGNIGANRPWSTDDGGGILSFADRLSIYGTAPNVYPANLDQATGQYAAGTFEYRSTSVILTPAAPAVTATGANGTVALSWPAVTAPAAATKYRIYRAATLAGTYTQLAEITALNYTDTGLTNGTTYFYKVTALTAANNESQDPSVRRGTPYQLAANRHIAYFAPSGLTGNSTSARTLGLDFDVQNPVNVTRLGLFDSGADGIQPLRDPGPDGIAGNDDDTVTSRTITVSLYNRADAAAAPLATQTFTTEAPGALIEGMRFLDLVPPLKLPAGFQGSVVTEGYGPGEPNGNTGTMLTTQDGGNASLLFTGSGRYGSAGSYPTTIDSGPAARYAAGTFEYESTTASAPGRPTARLSPGIEDGAATLVWDAVTTPVAAVKYNIYRNDGDETAPLHVLVGTSTSLTHRITGLTNGQTYRYTVRAVAANNTEGLASATLTATPDPLAAGVAYLTEAGSIGREAWGGALGMDFDVVNQVRVTRLGAYDSGSDGLALPIRVGIYDRTTRQFVTPLMVFPVDDPATPGREDGELEGGSRFLPLPNSVTLPVGFQGRISAYGYGGAELNGNINKGSTGLSTFSGGALKFVGASTYSGGPEYPTVIDSGVAAYGAGTFQFEVNNTPGPFPPAPVLTGENGRVRLTWTAVTHEIAAASYRILRATAAAGPYSQIAEVSATTYTDNGLANGTAYFYKMVSVGSGNILSRETSPMACAPYQITAGRHIAYFTPGNLRGNLTDASTRGMDFDVQNPVIINRLGWFDALSDGIQPDPGEDRIPGTADDIVRSQMTVTLFDRDTGTAKATLAYTPENPGTLIAGMRFKDLPAAITLPAGFRGSIVVEGYGPGEPLITAGGVESRAVWSLDDGSQSLLFTGSGRFGFSLGSLPDTLDTGLSDAYAAGTFEYQTTTGTVPGKPVVRLLKLMEDGAVSLAWDAVTVPATAAKYRVYRYDEAAQTYTLEGETTNLSYRVTGLTNGVPVSFVVTSVSASGVEGLRSDVRNSTPTALAAGVAYVVPELTTGSQTGHLGSLGMDFDVVNPVRITRLGAFDSGGEGLLRPITVSIYDRNSTTTPLVRIVFPLDDQATPAREDGQLTGGSRFLDLPQPLVLDAGFQGSVVAFNYGPEEPNGNLADHPWTTFNGGSLSFVGRSRWGAAPADSWPANPDATVNQYAAGTFYFEPGGPVIPTFDAGLTITRGTGNQVRIDWTATQGAVLQRSPDLKAGSWVNVPTAQPGYLTTVTGREFFRLIKP